MGGGAITENMRTNSPHESMPVPSQGLGGGRNHAVPCSFATACSARAPSSKGANSTCFRDGHPPWGLHRLTTTLAFAYLCIHTCTHSQLCGHTKGGNRTDHRYMELDLHLHCTCAQVAYLFSFRREACGINRYLQASLDCQS